MQTYRGNGKIRVDCCLIRVQSVLSALPQTEFESASQRGTRAFSSGVTVSAQELQPCILTGATRKNLVDFCLIRVHSLLSALPLTEFSAALELSAEALLSLRMEMLACSFMTSRLTGTTGKILVDLCRTRVQSILSALSQTEFENVCQRSTIQASMCQRSCNHADL